jgi:hypothetical protein
MQSAFTSRDTGGNSLGEIVALSSEYHRRQAATLTQLAQTTRNLEALLRMAAEHVVQADETVRITEPTDRPRGDLLAEIPPNRKKYRVTGVVRLRPLRGPRSHSHHSQKEPRAILSSGLPPMKSIDGMIGMTGR